MSAQTCFHGRHISPVILAGLDGTNWDLKGYEARGGYSALRRIFEQKIAPDAVIPGRGTVRDALMAMKTCDIAPIGG